MWLKLLKAFFDAHKQYSISVCIRFIENFASTRDPDCAGFFLISQTMPSFVRRLSKLIYFIAKG